MSNISLHFSTRDNLPLQGESNDSYPVHIPHLQSSIAKCSTPIVKHVSSVGLSSEQSAKELGEFGLHLE
jgi:hypothetical protein